MPSPLTHSGFARVTGCFSRPRRLQDTMAGVWEDKEEASQLKGRLVARRRSLGDPLVVSCLFSSLASAALKGTAGPRCRDAERARALERSLAPREAPLPARSPDP